jgi:hypothetical protein
MCFLKMTAVFPPKVTKCVPKYRRSVPEDNSPHSNSCKNPEGPTSRYKEKSFLQVTYAALAIKP